MQTLLDLNGQINKNDFIDYCIQVKLLDLTDKCKERKHENEEKMGMKKEKKKEVMIQFKSSPMSN